MFYVYVIRSKKDRGLYLGYTNNLKRRFEEHNHLENVYTKHKAPFELIYHEAYKTQSDAKFRERQLKRFAGAYNSLKRRIKNSI